MREIDTLDTGGANISALYTEAKRLLQTQDLPRGLALLAEAAHRGHAEASHHVAMVAAADDSIPDNWGYALAYIGRAAKDEYRPAQLQLAFLAQDAAVTASIQRGETLPPETWRRLHDAISPAEWLKHPAPQILSHSSHIAVVEKFISPAMCDWIIAKARPQLQPARVFDPRDGDGISNNFRTSSDMRFVFPDTDMILMFTAARICSLVGTKFHGHEAPSVLHYKPGQQFRAHHDYLDPAIPGHARLLPMIGQRHWTLLIYLNDDYEGGETAFPKLDIRFKGRKGDALLLRNVDSKGQPDPDTLHEGLPPTKGEKWLFSQWLLQPWRL